MAQIKKNLIKIDKIFLFLSALLLIEGFLMFFSASLGLITDNTESILNNFVTQLGLGLGVGLILAFIIMKLPYSWLIKVAPWVYVGSVILTALVFIPGLGLYHGGATRWLIIGPLSIQPSEFLKVASLLFASSLLVGDRSSLKTKIYYLIVMAISALILAVQRDTDTLLVLSIAMLAGAFAGRLFNLKEILFILLLGAIFIAGLIYQRPYLLERITTFANPDRDLQGAGYQVNQALIAVGSGQFVGKGFGQSVQKYGSLPEPTSDSIFAVAAEEFGFIGGVIIVLTFLFFALRGLRISQNAPDDFGRCLAASIIVLITVQSFVNISSMVGLVPLSGIPLVFMSHGGTAMLGALIMVGLVLNISRFRIKGVI